MLDSPMQAFALGALSIGVLGLLSIAFAEPMLRRILKISKTKKSSATSSIIMRRFLMQGSEHDPFVGLWAQAGDDEALVDIGAWSKGLDQ